MNQEPWEESEIEAWVKGKWPKLNANLFMKSDVNGKNTNPIYTWLKTCFPGDVSWNFATKVKPPPFSFFGSFFLSAPD